VGETVFVEITDLRVNAERDCFLRREAPVKHEKDILHPMRVTRENDGFHVALFSPWQWTITDNFKDVAKDWFPVASFVESYDEEK